MNTTYHFTSAQELTPAILDVIRQTYQEQPISIYIEADVSTMSDWEMQELKRREQIFLEPDDDYRNALSAEEFKKRALEMVERVHNRFASK